MTDKITVDRALLEQTSKAIDNLVSLFERTREWGCLPMELIAARASEKALRAALDQPAVEPVAWAYLFDDDGSLCQTFDTRDDADRWVESDDNLWSGYVAPLYAAPKPQQPECNPHPDAPHGFDRTASHTEDRYVCRCEYWKPDGYKPTENEGSEP